MRLLWAGNTLNFFLHDIFLLSVKFVESFVRKSVHHFSSILIVLFLWTEKDLGVTMCPKNEMFYTEAMGGGGAGIGAGLELQKTFFNIKRERSIIFWKKAVYQRIWKKFLGENRNIFDNISQKSNNIEQKSDELKKASPAKQHHWLYHTGWSIE